MEEKSIFEKAYDEGCAMAKEIEKKLLEKLEAYMAESEGDEKRIQKMFAFFMMGYNETLEKIDI